MSRSVAIHAALLAVALTAAYFVWTKEPSGSEEEVAIISMRGTLDKAVFAAEDRTVSIDRKKDDRGAYHWVRVETLEKVIEPPSDPASAKEGDDKAAAGDEAPAADKAPAGDKTPAADKAPNADKAPAADTPPAPEEPAAPAPAPEKKQRKVKVFLGNPAAEQLMESLANLSAVRALGKVSADKLKSFGLTDTKSTLTLVRGSSPRVFLIGDKTYGNMDTYIQDKEDGRVYVVRPRVLQDFRYAESRLMERRPWDLEMSEVERAVIQTPEQKLTAVQKNRRDQANAYWVIADAQESREDLVRNWFEKVNRLRAIEYLKGDKAPEGIQEVVSVTVLRGEDPLDTLRIYSKKVLPAAPPVSPGALSADYYARTGHTRALVKISRPLGEELIRDLAGLKKD